MSKKTQAKSASKTPAPASKKAGAAEAHAPKEAAMKQAAKPSKPLRALAAVAAKLMPGKTKAAPAKAPAKAPLKTGDKPAKTAAPAVKASKAAPVKSAASTKSSPTPVKSPAGKTILKQTSPDRVAKATPSPAAQSTAPAKKAAAAVPPVPSPAPKLTKTPRAPAKKAVSRAYDENGCRETACETSATTSGYCRLHYIKNWKKIKRKELILKEKKLNQYIEELVLKYPEKYIDAIRLDLADEKAFSKVIYDLELDESSDDIEVEGENDEDIIEGIKRGFEDGGDPEF